MKQQQNYSLINYKLVNSLLFLYLWIVPYICTDFIATISCQPCLATTLCAYASCYRIVSNSFDGQVCGNSNCNITTMYQVILTKCDYDYNGTQCTTGVCLVPPANGCTERYFGSNACTESQSWTRVSCHSCTSQANAYCPACKYVQSSTTSTIVQTCYTRCNGIQPFNLSLYPCSSNVDNLHNYCKCCYNYTASLVNNGLICTKSNKIFSGDSFNLYASSMANYEIQTIGWNIMGVVLLLGWIMIG